MTITYTQIHISDAEHRARCDTLLDHIRERNLTGVVLFDSDYVKYYCGFAFIPTERPIAFVMRADGERTLFVPRLEVEHARANALIDRVAHYDEYPGKIHPMHALAAGLVENGVTGELAADNDGYPWILGYRGPSLSGATNAHVHLVRGFIEDQMAVKSEAEIALIRESVRWANLAHMLLQRYTMPGASETEVSQRASNEATLAMLDAIGPVYRAQAQMGVEGGAFAGYRGQIGRNAAIPHALANNITFQPGDALVTGASAAVWGYLSELERTMFIGKPGDAQRRFFDHMLALQETALAAIRPGVRCADVDHTVREYFAKHELWPYWRHHVGHCIGLRYHEGPFLDLGDETIIQPGMVFTVEPGLYSPELGGFRHSDTVVVRGDGIEMLTYYPRDLDSLTLPV